ncbi:uncharacterized protein LOC121388552 [Gigantopelta aegis]|uniref:uncharacterized protein LOC121388552 n=1 Tax=Gigantopelta aegis TaxID=1735272 RepID=UPI001B88DD06|nr:uncharacterized protein LOC121388552 [Gigantopelta aegis]
MFRTGYNGRRWLYCWFCTVLLNTATFPPVFTAECKVELSPYYVPQTLASFNENVGHSSHGAVNKTTGFSHLWVTRCRIFREKPNPTQKSILVSATLNVDEEILYKGARLVNLLTRFIPHDLYDSVAESMSVGIYSEGHEHPDVFPEYMPIEECKATCRGDCSKTCTDRGIQISQQISYDGRRVVVPDGDKDCPFRDPVTRLQNLLVKEFASSLLKHGLTDTYKRQLEEAHKSGLSVWVGRPPVNRYFQQATLSWFQATKLSPRVTYGMNRCSGGVICYDEQSSRQNMKETDALLYSVLNAIFNNKNSYLIGGITLCEW